MINFEINRKMDITSSKRENRPFILSKTPKPTLLPSNYHDFNERVESFIRFVQGANTFVAVLINLF